jgi:hypothetical protein
MITIEQATARFSKPEYKLYEYNHFYHTFLKMADEKSPIKSRRSGKTKTYKRDGNKFTIPVKIGLRGFLHITEENAHEWSVTPP